MPIDSNNTTSEKSCKPKGNFIALHRKLKEWRWKTKPEVLALWIELLLSAQWHDSDFQSVKLERGQCIVGLPSLSKSTGLSIRTLRTCINRLKSTGEVTVKTTNKYSIVTILNYNEYQSSAGVDRQADRQADRHSTDRQPTTYNKDNKKKNIIYTPKVEDRIFTLVAKKTRVARRRFRMADLSEEFLGRLESSYTDIDFSNQVSQAIHWEAANRRSWANQEAAEGRLQLWLDKAREWSRNGHRRT